MNCDSCKQEKVVSSVRGGLANIFCRHPNTKSLRILCHSCMSEWRQAFRKLKKDKQFTIFKYKKDIEDAKVIKT